MLWFLGYVSKDDLEKCKYTPSFVLKVAKTGKWNFMPENLERNVRKALFNNINDRSSIAAIQYASSYSYRPSSKKGEPRTRYQLNGALFWYPCDIHGNQIQPPLFVLKVPRTTAKISELTRPNIENIRYKKTAENILYSQSPNYICLDATGVKPYFWSFECQTKEQYKQMNPESDDIIHQLFRS